MSTPNFHNRNARFIYACQLEDNDDAEQALLEVLRDAFSAAAADRRIPHITACESVHSTREQDELRSYPGIVFARVTSAAKTYRDFEFVIVAEIVLRWGYYADINLDYLLSYELDGISCEDDGTAECDLRDALDTLGYDEDRRERYVGLLRTWIARQQPPFIAAIEKIFAAHSNPLRCIGTASNGEAFYEPVKRQG